MKKFVTGLLSAPLLVLPLLLAADGGSEASDLLTGVPAEYLEVIMEAGSICDEITPSLIAAQIEAESGWDPTAVSPVGAQGISQFMPGTWATYGKDGNGDGKADPFDPQDAIISQGHYMCSLVDTVRRYLDTGQASGNITDLALAAYNAGPGAVQTHHGIPPFEETRNYVERIKDLAGKYQQATNTASSSTLLAAAQKYVGTPYKWGGTTSAGLDCSGLVWRAYADIGKPISARTADQIIKSAPVRVSPENLQPGDLIGFSYSGSSHVHHIGFYAGTDANGNRLMLHAPNVGGHVSTVSLDSVYWLSMDWYPVRI